MLTAIAIDDEPIALEVVKTLAGRIPFISMKGFFTNAFEGADFLRKEKVDLIFLDIKMPDINGIDFLRAIPNPPMIIFTTAYAEHAVQSFELNAIDYLLKPFSQARFLKACSKAHEQYELRRNSTIEPPEAAHIFVKSGHEQVRVILDEILYLESSGNYMLFVLENRKIASRLTMSEAQTLLPGLAFVRIHRSYMVAKKKVSKVDHTSVWIKQAELPIGSVYAASVKKIWSE